MEWLRMNAEYDETLIGKFAIRSMAPYSYDIYRIKNLMKSSDNVLVISCTDNEGREQPLIVDLNNKFDVDMLYKSLAGQIGEVAVQDNVEYVQIDLNRLIGHRIIVLRQRGKSRFGKQYNNLRALIVVDLMTDTRGEVNDD